MLFPSNWPSAQATNRIAAQPSIPPTNDRAAAPASDEAGLLDMATVNYSGSEKAPAETVNAMLVAGFQAAAAGTGAPQSAALSASAQLARLAMNIAGAATEISPYKMGAPS